MADSKQTTSSVTPAPRIGEHAIVIGASVAGLLAARVLSDSYDRVTVLDRDTLPEGRLENRRAVPQGYHAHGLQLGGQAAIEDLLPGYHDEALAAGSTRFRPGLDTRFCIGGHDLARVSAGPDAVFSSRKVIEGIIRRRVGAIANVTLRDRIGVVGFVDDGGRVRGVRALDAAPGSTVLTLRADLVVAASGRGGKVRAWLESMGYDKPAEERIGVDIRYSSRILKLRDGAVGDDTLILNGAHPGRARGVAALVEEGGAWNVTLYGYGPDHRPPSDAAEFNAFAATVTDPEFAAAIEQADPVSDVFTHGYAAAVRRRYDRMKRFPEGLLVMGDAMCSFNPIYGQGMSVAALEAVELRRCLRAGDRKLAKRFFKAARRPVEQAWKLSTGADLAMPEVDEVAALPDRLVGRYFERFLAAAAHDGELTRTFINVTGLVAPMTKLLSPATMLRVRRVNRRHAAVAAAPAAQGALTAGAEATA
jgi:2-polyprenyl-6-methoxyphenol hydroxylase-like FAD-dependent oxidoreductase